MKIIFAGTPLFAAIALDALIKAGHEINLVLTQPDRPAGRGMKTASSAVKLLAQQHKLPLLQPLTLKAADIQAHLQALHADVMIVAAYAASCAQHSPFGLLEYSCIIIAALAGCRADSTGYSGGRS